MHFEFIHTADLHLDSPMRGLSRYEGVPEESMRSATRAAFEQLIDEAIRRQVAFILIAGDVSDGGWNDVNTGLFFIKQCGRAAAVGIRVFVIWGNHDADSEGARKLAMPAGVHVFGSRKAEQIEIAELQVMVTGQSYGRREVTENLAAGYPPATPGRFNVALLHTALSGYSDHLPYAPCDLGTLRALNMDYWALGHVHTREIVSKDPWVVFPGNLQGRSVRETGPRGALVVQVQDGQVRGVEELEVDVARWAIATVDVAAAKTLLEVSAKVRDQLSVLVTGAGDRPLAVRVHLVGKTLAHTVISRDQTELENQLRAVAAGLHGGKIWIEKIRVNTIPVTGTEGLANRGDAVAELKQLLDASMDNADLHRVLQEELSDVALKVPSEVVSEIESARYVKEQRWSELITRVSPGLIDSLLAGE